MLSLNPRALLLLSLCIILVIYIYFFYGVAKSFKAEAYADFESEAISTSSEISLVLNNAKDSLLNVIAMFASSSHVNEKVLQEFIEKSQFFQLNQHIRAIAIGPLLESDQLETYNIALRSKSTTRQALGYPEFKPVTLQSRDGAIPMTLVESPGGREGIVGFDMASSEARLKTVRQSLNDGSIVMTPPVKLSQDSSDAYPSVLLVGSSKDAHIEYLTKLPIDFKPIMIFAASFTPGAAIDQIISDKGSQLFDINIVEVSNGKTTIFQGHTPNGDDPLRTDKLEFAGHEWSIEYYPSDQISSALPPWLHALFTAGILLLIGLAWSINALIKIRGSLKEQVAEQTQDLKNAKQAADEAKERLEKAQRIAKIGNWKLDLTANRLTWSDEIYRIFGCEPQEFTATYETFLDFIHPDDRAAVDEAYSRSVKEGSDNYEIEHRIVRQGTGEIRHVYERCVHVRDDAGAIIQSIGMVQDITERKQAEELNRESAERAKMQRNLIAQLTFEDSIVNTSIDDALKTVTRKLAATLQVDRATVWLLSEDETKLQRLALYDAATGLHSQIDDLNAVDIPSYFEALRKDSQVGADDAQNDPRTKELTDDYFIPLQISSLLDSAIQQDGRLIGVLSAEHRGPVREWHADEKSFLSAITNLVAQLFANAERKQAEEAVRLNEEKMKSIFRVAPTGIGVVINRTFTEINPRVCEMTGYRSEELLGKSTSILYPTQEEHEFVGKEKYRQIAKHGTGSVETRWQRKDGKIIDVLLSSTPVDSDDQSKGATFTALDITEIKRFREELKQLNAELEWKVEQRTSQLEASNKELEAFSYSVSHDLRAPLRHISGYVDLLNKRFREDLPEKAGHYLNEITDSASQMGGLIDDLLQFSRTGRQDLQQADMDMNAAVQEALEKQKAETKDRNISWNVADLPRVYGDYSLLKQVWINLLENAVKYTRQKDEAEIEVGFTRGADQWEFFVRDNGAGFDMQYVHKLFGVFQRLHPPAQFEGTGIGLANVQRIIHKHGGRVRAEGRPEKGAIFYFTIPRNSFDEGGKS